MRPIPGIAVPGRDRRAAPGLDLLQGIAEPMASPSTVITGDGVRSSRCIMPPLIAPGSVGSWVCPSTGVVTTAVYSPPAIGTV